MAKKEDKKNLVTEFTSFLIGGDDKKLDGETSTRTAHLDSNQTKSIHKVEEEEASSTKAQPGDDKTVPVSRHKSKSEISQISSVNQGAGSIKKESSLEMEEVRKFNEMSSSVVLSAKASLVQAEQLRIAQNRIKELENHLEVIREENEQLSAVSSSLKSQTEDLNQRIEDLEKKSRQKIENLNEEKSLLDSALKNKGRETNELKFKIEELENRLNMDLKKVRVRERELENRLELVKVEKVALVNSKDETILSLKRRVDQLLADIENYRGKGRKLSDLLNSNEDRIQRSVRALRLALSMLEGEMEEATELKKAK